MKTPTIKELRALAKRKFGPSASVERGTWPSTGCHAINVWVDEQNTSGRRWWIDFNCPTWNAAKAGVYAALRALPDKKVAR